MERIKQAPSGLAENLAVWGALGRDTVIQAHQVGCRKVCMGNGVEGLT
jgi:hypothetical protein